MALEREKHQHISRMVDDRFGARTTAEEMEWKYRTNMRTKWKKEHGVVEKKEEAIWEEAFREDFDTISFEVKKRKI